MHTYHVNCTNACARAPTHTHTHRVREGTTRIQQQINRRIFSFFIFLLFYVSEFHDKSKEIGLNYKMMNENRNDRTSTILFTVTYCYRQQYLVHCLHTTVDMFLKSRHGTKTTGRVKRKKYYRQHNIHTNFVSDGKETNHQKKAAILKLYIYHGMWKAWGVERSVKTVCTGVRSNAHTHKHTHMLNNQQFLPFEP